MLRNWLVSCREYNSILVLTDEIVVKRDEDVRSASPVLQRRDSDERLEASQPEREPSVSPPKSPEPEQSEAATPTEITSASSLPREASLDVKVDDDDDILDVSYNLFAITLPLWTVGKTVDLHSKGLQFPAPLPAGCFSGMGL